MQGWVQWLIYILAGLDALVVICTICALIYWLVTIIRAKIEDYKENIISKTTDLETQFILFNKEMAIFNVADAFITIGVVILLIYIFKEGKYERSNNK